VPLRAVGGVERSYSEFIGFRDSRFPVEHHTVALGREIPPVLEPRIRAASASISLGHFDGTRHIPFAPAEPRERHLERLLCDLEPDVALFWNKPMGVAHERLPSALPVVYWEHGRAWKETDTGSAQRFLAGVRAVLCNSQAAKRFLELRWQLPREIAVHVCPNAVRPEAIGPAPDAPVSPAPAGSQTLRLGFAGRLVPVKGAPLALHVVRELQRRGVACTLALAGEGDEREALERQAELLGVGDAVRLLGLVDDMRGFFAGIDCLLCPSLREPFGLVAAEALANGCPVVATRVDGLAEVVDDVRVGRSVVPRLPLERYRDYGGDPAGVPPEVYHPIDDALGPPRVPDPAALADAVLELVQPSAAERAEQAAASRALAAERFDFARHVRRVLGILAEISSTG
jgi:glycosyltransferase involved in cell wall biosynthesis